MWITTVTWMQQAFRFSFQPLGHLLRAALISCSYKHAFLRLERGGEGAVLDLLAPLGGPLVCVLAKVYDAIEGEKGEGVDGSGAAGRPALCIAGPPSQRCGSAHA